MIDAKMKWSICVLFTLNTSYVQIVCKTGEMNVYCSSVKALYGEGMGQTGKQDSQAGNFGYYCTEVCGKLAINGILRFGDFAYDTESQVHRNVRALAPIF